MKERYGYYIVIIILQRDNSVTIHQKNIEALATMMYKVINNIALTTVSEFFSFSNVNYNNNKWLPVSSAICVGSMEWTGNLFILRTKNLENGVRGNETKINIIWLQKIN